jgi:hypothetical protein
LTYGGYTHAFSGVSVVCERRGYRRYLVTAVTVVIAPRYVTRQTFVGKDQLISRRLIDYR